MHYRNPEMERRHRELIETYGYPNMLEHMMMARICTRVQFKVFPGGQTGFTGTILSFLNDTAGVATSLPRDPTDPAQMPIYMIKQVRPSPEAALATTHTHSGNAHLGALRPLAQWPHGVVAVGRKQAARFVCCLRPGRNAQDEGRGWEDEEQQGHARDACDRQGALVGMVVIQCRVQQVVSRPLRHLAEPA